MFRRRPPDHLNLARAHRWLQRVALAAFGVLVVAPLAIGFLAPIAVQQSPFTWRWWGVGVVASFIALGGQTLRIAWFSGAAAAEMTLAAIGLCIPGINLGFVMAYDNRAATLISAAGARVGMMGAGEAELPKIADGRCVRCDYDLRGIDAAPCPECGHMNAAPKFPPA